MNLFPTWCGRGDYSHPERCYINLDHVNCIYEQQEYHSLYFVCRHEYIDEKKISKEIIQQPWISIEVNFIGNDGKVIYYVIPKADYEKMLEVLKELRSNINVIQTSG